MSPVSYYAYGHNITRPIKKMAARMSNSSGELDNADGEQRRETRRKYREFIQDLQGILF